MMQATSIFYVFLLWNIFITFRSSPLWSKYVTGASNRSADTADPEEKIRHMKLLKKYLFVYLLATLGDWLQGPYVYALYASYGYSQHDNAILFVAGFGSSMIFGSFIGGMADWGGRRRFVILYGICYALSCATKHFNSYGMLMIGRLLGGVSTSLLFSVFETWMVRAHADNKIGKSLLNTSFTAASYGNSIIAIVAGLIAERAAEAKELTLVSGTFHVGGYLGPFDVSLVVCIVCAVAAFILWEENYGESTSEASAEGEGTNKGSKWYDGLKNAYTVTIRSTDILICGIVSSCFEGCMYVFVFMWTPSLTSFINDGESLPFGVIFSTFMVCCMAGSSTFSILVTKVKGEALAVGVFFVAATCMAIISMSPTDTIAFVAMNVFEMCVGMYFPIMGSMKGSIVPEDKRAAIYNLYRIPLNFFVLFNLLMDFKPVTAFALNACVLATATVLQFILMKRRFNTTSNSIGELIERAQQQNSSSSPSSPKAATGQEKQDEEAQLGVQPLLEKV